MVARTLEDLQPENRISSAWPCGLMGNIFSGGDDYAEAYPSDIITDQEGFDVQVLERQEDIRIGLVVLKVAFPQSGGTGFYSGMLAYKTWEDYVAAVQRMYPPSLANDIGHDMYGIYVVDEVNQVLSNDGRNITTEEVKGHWLSGADGAERYEWELLEDVLDFWHNRYKTSKAEDYTEYAFVAKIGRDGEPLSIV